MGGSLDLRSYQNFLLPYFSLGTTAPTRYRDRSHCVCLSFIWDDQKYKPQFWQAHVQLAALGVTRINILMASEVLSTKTNLFI